MTVSGICESLIASAIWAVLAFGLYRLHKRFKEENKTHEVLFETIKSVLATELGLNRKQDLHLMILLLINRYRGILNGLYYNHIVTYLLLLYVVTQISKESVWFFITSFLCFVLLLLEIFQIRLIKKKVHEFDVSIVEGIHGRMLDSSSKLRSE